MNGDSRNSSSPAHSRSMISFFLRVSHSDVMRRSFAQRGSERLPRAGAAEARQAARDHLERQVGLLLETLQLVFRERRQVRPHRRLVGQRDLQCRRVRVLDHELAQVVQPLAHQHRRDARVEDLGVVRPAEDLDDVRAERSAERHRVAARHHELREVDDHRDAARGVLRRQALQRESAQEIAVEQLERRGGLGGAREVRRRVTEGIVEEPCEVLAAAARADAAAPVVVQHHVPRVEHHVVEERAQRQQLPGLALVHLHHVEDVSVQQELRDRARAEQLAHLLGPRGQRGAHARSMARGRTVAGGSLRRSDTPP